VHQPIGRDGLLDDLRTWFAPAASGGGRAALLLGDAGVGKSTVADALAARLGVDGFRVMRGWCSPAGMPPLWPWRRALAQLLPDRTLVHGDAGPDDPAALFAAVVEALERLTEPLVIVIDDLQWADPSSLALLRTVADALPVVPVGLVATVRDEPVEARGALADLPTSVRRVPIGPLDDTAAAALVGWVSRGELDASHVAAVVARAGGNPFFLTEITRLVVAHGQAGLAAIPAGVREVLDRRLARLSQASASLLAAAAVVGETAVDARDPIDETLLARVTGIDADTIAEQLDEAAAAGLIEPDPSGTTRLRFTHALVREVLAGGLPRAELGRLHRRTAEALESQAPAGAPASGLAEALAHHWARAAGADAPNRAAAWSLAAADAAVSGLGFDQAVAHLRRALAGPGVDRVDVLLRLGRAQRLAGDLTGARASFLDAAERATDPDALADAALGIGGGPIGFEVPIADDGQVAALCRALDALDHGDGPRRAAVLGRLSLAQTGLTGADERRRLAEQAVAMADRVGDAEVLVGALAAYCDAVAGPDYVEQRLAATERMLAVATDRVPILLARRLRLLAFLERGDVAEADREIEAYSWAAEAVGLPLYQWLPQVWRGARALMSGDVTGAARYAAEAAATGRRADSRNAELLAQTLRMHLHLTTGTAGQVAGEIRDLLAAIAHAPLPVTYRAAPVVVLLAAGDPGPARAALRSYLATPAPDIAADAEWLEGHWALAEAAIALRDTAAAARLYGDLKPYARLWAVDGIGAAVFGTVGHQLGRLADLLGRRREAAGHLAEALAAYERAAAAGLAARLRAEAGLPAPASSDRVEGELRRDGPIWRIAWRGAAGTVPDSKGMRDLAALLGRPGQPVPAVHLAGGPAAAEGGLGELLDGPARAAYRRRLEQLDAEIAEAQTVGRLERAEAERAAIAAELGAATGLHGSRIAGDPADRARKAVTMRIRAAVRAIEAADPALARHLTNAVKTGRLCSYEPDIEVVWRL
jgi:tetratricopeptide (TPR) repeat protein